MLKLQIQSVFTIVIGSISYILYENNNKLLAKIDSLNSSILKIQDKIISIENVNSVVKNIKDNTDIISSASSSDSNINLFLIQYGLYTLTVIVVVILLYFLFSYFGSYITVQNLLYGLTGKMFDIRSIYDVPTPKQ